MPKLERASMQYVVSFNTTIDGDEYGEEDRDSEDYQGDNLEELIEEVIASDPNYPMTYETNTEGGLAVGHFYSDDSDHYKVAVIVHLDEW